MKFGKKYLFSTMCLLLLSNIFAQKIPRIKQSLIRFTENKNQWESFIKYRAQLDGGALFIQKDKLTYHFYEKDVYRSMHANSKAKPKEVRSSWFNIDFINANPNVTIQNKNAAKDYNNYFIGDDKTKWATNVKNYFELTYIDIWPGINLEMLGMENSLKTNFYVAGGADINEIKLNYEGVKNIHLKEGQLYIETVINEITEHAPYAYQIIDGEKKEVPCKFVLKKNILSYSFPQGYDKTKELVIDPVLVFACSSGSTADNFGMTATYDNDGNLYSGGTAFNIGFPVVNAYDPTYNSLVQYGQTDIVLTKYDSSGTFLHYSTYLGGTDDADAVNSLIVDDQNNLLAYGATASTDFPTTTRAYDTVFNGGQTLRFYYNGAFFENGTDIYISKLSSGGNNLLASTFIGGSMNDGVNYTVNSSFVGTIAPYGSVYQPNYDSLFFNYGDQNRGEIQIDNNGDVLLASSTRSANFPTINGFDNTLNGVQDAIVFKMDNDLENLIWSSFLGGSSMDAGNAISFDKNNNVFVTGGTCSSDFPATTGSYQSSYNGGKTDGYIVKIDASGNSIAASSFIGTSLYDVSHFVQTDKLGNVYLLGQSAGTIPVFNAIYSNTNGKIFVMKLNNSLNTLQYSTVIGNGTGNIDLSPSAFLVDYCENVYFSGWGGNIITGPATTNMPLTANATQSTTDGFNFYLMSLEHDMNSLLYASYFGGPQSQEHVDGGTSRFDKKGIIYQSVCAGCGNHDDFPVTPGSWPTSLYGNNWNQSNNCNNGTFKLNFQIPLVVAQFTTNQIDGCAPFTVQLNNQSSGTYYLWDFGNNDTTSIIFNPIKTFSTPGTYTINLYVVDSSRCNIADTAQTIVTVNPVPNAAATASIHPCSNTFDFINNSSSGTNPTYTWYFGDGNDSIVNSPTYTYASNGSYTVSLVSVDDNGCKDSTSFPVQMTLSPDSAGLGNSYCLDSIIPTQLFATGGGTYSWSPSSGLSNPSISNPIASPTATTIYTVTISETDFGGNTCATTHTIDLTVYPQVIADFNSSSNACGNTYQFTDATSGSVSGWDWNFGDATIDSIQNPSHSYSTPGTYNVQLIVENSFGCNDTIIKPITLGGFNPISVNANQTICFSEQVQLNASGGISYSWSPSTGLNNTSIPNPIASPTVSTNYTVTITTINTLGDTCTSPLQTAVNVATLSGMQITTSANPDTIYMGESSLVSSNINAPSGILWSPSYGLSSNTAYDPIATPLHTTTYSAIVTDGNGCKYLIDSVTIYVIAKICDEGSVFIPNTFSPNNDGVNDILYARSNFITDLYFAVYDRWGEKVFETTDPAQGWDGIYKGMKADPGVFGYYLKYTCNNGEESFKKGNVTLIR